jgi:hypothetical protein
MAVRIPIRAIMPKAMMQIVRIALTLFDLIALIATLRFSLKIPLFIISFTLQFSRPASEVKK